MRKTLRSDILLHLSHADLIQFNNELTQADYIRSPDDNLVQDDVLVEFTVNGQPQDLTFAELEDAEDLGDGSYLVKHRGVVRFLQQASVH